MWWYPCHTTRRFHSNDDHHVVNDDQNATRRLDDAMSCRSSSSCGCCGWIIVARVPGRKCVDWVPLASSSSSFCVVLDSSESIHHRCYHHHHRGIACWWGDGDYYSWTRPRHRPLPPYYVVWFLGGDCCFLSLSLSSVYIYSVRRNRSIGSVRNECGAVESCCNGGVRFRMWILDSRTGFNPEVFDVTSSIWTVFTWKP